MARVAMTGSASGIGAATRARLETDGHEVLGIDVKDAEVVADLSTREGRRLAIERTIDWCDGRLDRLVLCAGIGGHVGVGSKILGVNYFGAVEVLDGLLDALRAGRDPRAVVVCSNSAQLAPVDEAPYVLAMLDGDEDRAGRLIDEIGSGPLAYMASKHALGRAIRRRAVAWGEARVPLNGVAPGPVRTPLYEADRAAPGTGEAIRNLKVPMGPLAEPGVIAGLIAFLLGPEAGWIHGSIYYIDGGMDAAIRPDRF
jgi:NAD(P)-dependent dehydrogenase (short-subunit alcohol dehydrogenase family)